MFRRTMSNPFSALVLAAWSLAIPAAAQTAQAPAPSAAPSPEQAKILQSTEAFVRNLFAWGPDIKVTLGPLGPSVSPDFYDVPVQLTINKQISSGTVYVSKDGKTFLRGEMYDTSLNPYADNLVKLRLTGDPSVGLATAKIMFVEFSDFECPHCRELHETLKTLIPEHPEVRFIFKDYPLTQIHPWAETAAIGAHCAFLQSPKAFAPVDAQIFAEQELLSAENIWEKLISYAAQAGLDPDAFKSCMSSPEAKAAVDASHQEGEALAITSTPTLFVNGHPLVGGDKPTLEQYIKYDLSTSPPPSAPSHH
jgi:protein-disulfide isomerase